MDKFLDASDQPKLNQGNINHLYRSITSNEIEEEIKCLPTKKSPGPNGFPPEFYQTFNEDLIPKQSSNISMKYKRKSTAKIILRSQYYIHPKTEYKKMKLKDQSLKWI
jgi:hypothetical protein